MASQTAVQRRVSAALRIDEETKLRVYLNVAEAARLRNVPYWLGILFSSAISTLGLVLNSPAVVIGAMLISPLMDPIMTIGMATAIGDLRLSLRAIGTLLLSVLTAVVFAALLVKLLPFHATTPEILARTNPTLLDLAIAVASGLAGSVATARSGSQSALSALPGVAIAVALMPPLCTLGFGVGVGWSRSIIVGSGLLFLTNLVAIVASAFVVFLSVGLRTPQVLENAMRTPPAESSGPLVRLLNRPSFLAASAGKKLHVRAAVLLVLLLAISIPLKRSLTQVVTETRERNVVQDGLQRLAPSSDLVSQNVDVTSDDVDVALVTARNIPQAKVKATENWMQARIQKPVHLRVIQVASQTEVDEMVRNLSAAQSAAAPPPAPKPPPTLTQLTTDARATLAQALAASWPAAAPPIDTFDLELSPQATKLIVHYTAKHPISADSTAILQNVLQKAAKLPGLTLQMQRTWPPRATSSAPARQGRAKNARK